MATRRQSVGKCGFCGETFSKAAMTRHLIKCNQLRALAPQGKQRPAPAFHLVVEGGWGKVYWLHLAVPPRTPLSRLDKFLRHIWLECCGHLSSFEIEGIRYFSSDMPDEEERGMEVPSCRVVGVGAKFTYEYDFGSTTQLRLKVVGLWNQGEPEDGVELLARNEPPAIMCVECEAQPATEICTECGDAWLCESCLEEHECNEEMRLLVVNSPRAGVCGYTGWE